MAEEEEGGQVEVQRKIAGRPAEQEVKGEERDRGTRGGWRREDRRAGLGEGERQWLSSTDGGPKFHCSWHHNFQLARRPSFLVEGQPFFSSHTVTRVFRPLAVPILFFEAAASAKNAHARSEKAPCSSQESREFRFHRQVAKMHAQAQLLHEVGRDFGWRPAETEETRMSQGGSEQEGPQGPRMHETTDLAQTRVRSAQGWSITGDDSW